MFSITQGKGFHITFENGYTVSVQFGMANYCENRNFDIRYENWREEEVSAGERGSSNAEVAIMDNKGNFVGQELGFFDGDGVEGWCSPARVIEIMNGVSQLDDCLPQKEKSND